MAKRRIKDAKDLTTGELIYFRGHAKATYLSDGSTLEEKISNIEKNIGTENIISITYSDLVDLRNNSELNPGQKYRIIDYVTTTSQPNTQSAGHQFDIIVEALSENTLSEDAKAIQNENDGYFDESNLEAWELKYCLDNDTSRFAWAGDVTSVNSENVNIIDTLITDNEFNEPFLSDYYIYVDTAGNNVNRYTLGDEMRDSDFFIEYGRETSPDGLENQLCIYKNDLSDENYVEGGAEEGVDYADKFFYWGTEEVDGIIYDKWRKSEVDSGWNITEDGGSVFILTQRITAGEIIEDNSGKGVIYYMKDEFHNECPYDFKNIQFVRYKLNPPTVGGYNEEWRNQLSRNIDKMFKNNQLSYIWHGSNNEDYYWEDEHSMVFSTVTEETKSFYTFSNIINDEITDKSLTNVCYSNVIKESYKNKVLKLNNNIFFSVDITNNCDSNSFGNNCEHNSLGNHCDSNSFGNNCDSNSFGNYCTSNSFGDSCTSNSFGDNCDYNSYSYNCKYNSFGNECYYNSLGNNCDYNSYSYNCKYNSFDNNCKYNSFGNYCESNSLGDSCTSNSLGNNCRYNSFGEYCYSNSSSYNCHSNSFGNYCCFNSFGHYYNYNSFGNLCKSNSFGNYCDHNSLGNTCDSNSFGNNCDSNSFGNNCEHNSFGEYCNNNSFDNRCYSNSFGDSCDSNSFGNDCYSNSLGDNFRNNSFGNDCYSNSFGDHCYSNSFGNNCYSNSFGDHCYSNSFGNNCYCNGFFDGGSYVYNDEVGEYLCEDIPLDYVQNNKFGDSCNNLLIYINSEVGPNESIQNLNIAQGLSSISKDIDGIYYPELIKIDTVGQDYEIKIARNSKSEIKIYCEADLIG